MIQQMIYKGTVNGYKTVAFSNGLERTSLINRLEMMCRAPGSVWNEQNKPCPIFSRYEVDGGFAYSATVKDIHDDRDRGLTHVLFISKEECSQLLTKMVPLGAFVREFSSEDDRTRLPELEISQITESMNGQRFLESVKKLFDNESVAACFFESYYRFIMQIDEKNIRGICIVLPQLGKKHSEAAFIVMESIARILLRPDSYVPGYRTMWTGPDNNIQFPIFFTSNTYMSSTDALTGLRYIVVDAEKSKACLSRNEEILPRKEVRDLSAAIFSEDFEAFKVSVKKMEMVLKTEYCKKTQPVKPQKQADMAKETVLKQPNAKKTAEKKDNTVEKKEIKKTKAESSPALDSDQKKPVVVLPISEIKKNDTVNAVETMPLFNGKEDTYDISVNSDLNDHEYDKAKEYTDALFKEIEGRFTHKRNDILKERVFAYLQKAANDDPDEVIRLVDKATDSIRIVCENVNPKSEEFIRLSKYMHLLSETILSDLLIAYEKRKIKKILVRLKNIRMLRKFNEKWFLKWTPYIKAVFQETDIADFKQYYKDYRIILQDDGVECVKQEISQMHEIIKRLIKSAVNAPEKSQMQRLYETAVLLFAFSRVQLNPGDTLKFNTLFKENFSAFLMKYGFGKFKTDFLLLVKRMS